MLLKLLLGFICLAAAQQNVAQSAKIGDNDYTSAKSVYDFSAKSIDGEVVDLEKYKGNVLLIVNVATKCGLSTNHYTEMAELDKRYKERGLKILVFPSNQFLQEPGTNEEIKEYVKKYNANLELFDKVYVNGDEALPLYKYLKKEQGGMLFSGIKWNFTKFIINRKGIPVAREAGNVSPLDKKIVDVIESCLNETVPALVPEPVAA